MSVEDRRTVDLFDYLSLLFWQAVMSGRLDAAEEALGWLGINDETEWGQCDVCLRWVSGNALSERDRHQQQYCPECRP